MTLQFEELNEVDMRSLWPHEAHDFTPWLANHLEHLSQAVGIPMELEGTEVSVGPFSADILARDPSDNRILIENQLEYTDHTHLGQVLTYLAGLEAQTVIWIARSFQNPHLSEIRWLNEHTADPFAFFAVQVKVLRIGQDSSSPMSLRFEVLESPTNGTGRFEQGERAVTGAQSTISTMTSGFITGSFIRRTSVGEQDAGTATSTIR